MNPEMLNELFKAAGVKVKLVECSNEEGCQKEDEDEGFPPSGREWSITATLKIEALKATVDFVNSSAQEYDTKMVVAVAREFYKFLISKD